MRFPIKELEASQIIKKLEHFFDQQIIIQKATDAGFVKRKSKLYAMSFLQLCFIDTHNACWRSLTQACTFLREIVGVKLRKQSLDSRFNAFAVTFIKSLVEEVIKKQVCLVDPAESLENTGASMSKFKRILIGDSTSFSLPAQFTTAYKGSGGMYSTSAIKLYYEYDLLSGSLNCIKDADGVKSDQTFNEVDSIHSADLVMKDLGFYQMPFFRKLHQKGAYFISRLAAGSKLFVKDKRVSLETLLSEMPACISSYEFGIGIGSDKKERTALGEIKMIVEKVPIAVYEQRIRKIRAKYESKARQPSKEQLLWNKYNIFVTNIPAELLSIEQVKKIYRLRWQIEILFKTWKSIFHINLVKPMQLYRFQCVLLSSLLIILLFMPLLHFFKHYLWQKTGKEVSEWKMLVWLKNHLTLIHNFCKQARFAKFAKLFYAQILQDGFKEKRKKKGEYTHFIPLDILAAA
ncbi:IS4 family transposase [Rhodocytophaga aerolata]|uniref:IS4 family transposase n=1 Tax=Rhodocytophaga aerolata TaxID=455078 RepID=A0ABT8RI43_9BACT|nr:IS4 family transposase [Rhodocytophaga aerolata]MDO1451639.1 IS4 family transposase [Rhodocytophaga aerolata]